MAGEDYLRKLRDPRWQKVRLEIFQRDAWSCQDCGCKTRTLHVHHDKYTEPSPWNEPAEHLRTLCEDCHAKTHDGLAIPEEEMELRITHLRKNFSVAHRMVVNLIGEAEALGLMRTQGSKK